MPYVTIFYTIFYCICWTDHWNDLTLAEFWENCTAGGLNLLKHHALRLLHIILTVLQKLFWKKLALNLLCMPWFFTGERGLGLIFFRRAFVAQWEFSRGKEINYSITILSIRGQNDAIDLLYISVYLSHLVIVLVCDLGARFDRTIRRLSAYPKFGSFIPWQCRTLH